MPKYIQIERSDMAGSYVEEASDIMAAVESELLTDLEYCQPGVKIVLTIVEMSQEEYEALPEFMGW